MAIRLGLILLLAVFAQGNGFDFRVPARDQIFLTERTTENRIINGTDAVKGQFPYQVGMHVDKEIFCGGSLISPTWVLTSAYCVIDATSFTVFLGALVIDSSSESGRIAMNSREATCHDDFNRFTLSNDIGVVKLPKEAPLNDQINVISLPPRSFANKDFAGQTVQVSGWGRISDSSTSINSKLQFADLTVISNEKCKETYEDIIVTPTKVCTDGPDGKTPCIGDGGGPLVIRDKETNKTTHFGIISFVHFNGCEAQLPSGYERTYMFLDWINSKTGLTIQD